MENKFTEEQRLAAYIYAIIRILALKDGNDPNGWETPYMCDMLREYCRETHDIYSLSYFPEVKKRDPGLYAWFETNDFDSRIELLGECIDEVLKLSK